MKVLQEFIKGFKKGMKDFGESIASIFNSIMLFVVYFVGVGLTWLISKLTKRELLDTKISKKRRTYWTDFNLKTKSIEEYYKQF